MFMGPTNTPSTSQPLTELHGFPTVRVPVPTPAAPGLLGDAVGQRASMMVGMRMPRALMYDATSPKGGWPPTSNDKADGCTPE